MKARTIAFKVCFAVIQATTLYHLWLYSHSFHMWSSPAHINSSKSFADSPSVNNCTKHHVVQVFPLLFFSLPFSQTGPVSLFQRGNQETSCPTGHPRVHLHCSLAGEHKEAISWELTPNTEAKYAWQHEPNTEPGLNYYLGKFILSLFGCACMSCSYSFGLP